MSAAELRKAASTLRDLVAALDPWDGGSDHESWADAFDADKAEREHGYPSPDWRYVATMHPGVGLALADWLEDVAEGCEHNGTCAIFAAGRLADLINGGAA